MRRLIFAGSLALAGLGGFLGWLLWPATRGDALCRAVPLQEEGTGAIIQGTEDVVLNPEEGRLIVSAYDRRKNAPGGLYALPLSSLKAFAGAPITARALSLRTPHLLRPHGIALMRLGDGTERLYAINRIARPSGRAAELLVVRLRGDSALLEQSLALPCGANDLLPLSEGMVLVTVDRAACSGLKRLFADALNLARGSVVAVEADGMQRSLATRIAFANGIVEADGLIYVAATRARKLLVYDRAALLEGATRARPLRSVVLSGAPDNLSRGADGRLYIAAHRSLFRLAAYASGLRSSSAGDVFVYDPAGDEPRARRLFGLARILDGPTSAVAAEGLVIVGGGFSTGLALCSGEREAEL